MTDTTTAASEPCQAVGAPVEQPVRPRAWWRLSIYAGCWPCVTVDENEADFWRSEGLTVVELGAVAAERERCAQLCDGYAKRGGLTTAEEVTAKTLADILRA